MNIPMLDEAHVGFLLLQSKHTYFLFNPL